MWVGIIYLLPLNVRMNAYLSYSIKLHEKVKALLYKNEIRIGDEPPMRTLESEQSQEQLHVFDLPVQLVDQPNECTCHITSCLLHVGRK